MEHFDVVDENDKPTGKLTTRQEAENADILHRCVAVFAFDVDNNLLVQHHKKSGMFDHSVGGHVEAGEDYLTAAYREAAEELGIKNVQFDVVATSLYSDEVFDAATQKSRIKHMFGIYECQLPPAWKFVPNDEVEHITPMTIEEVIRCMHERPDEFTPGFINTMTKYLEVKQLPFELDMTDIRKRWYRKWPK